MSLRRRFAFILVAFALLVTAGGGFWAWSIASEALEAEMNDKLEQVIGAAAAVELDRDQGVYLTYRPGDETVEGIGWIALHTRVSRLEEFVAGAWILNTRSFTAIVTSRPAEEVPIGTELPELELYRSEIAAADSLGIVTTSPLYTGPEDEVYKLGFMGLGTHPSGVVLAVQMRADYVEPLALFQSRIVQASLVAAFIALMLAGVLASTVAVPLERLSRAAIKIQRGRWSDPVPQERGREIGRLSRAMERMRTGILSRDEQLRLMLAQVAHEIRNPLGGLELFASAALDSDDEEERNRILTRIRQEVDGLNQIINNFLAFARPLEPDQRIHDVRVPLTEAAELVAMEVCKDGKDVEVDLPDHPLMANADPTHVKRVVLNLLRNGVQAGQTVSLSAGHHHGEIRIRVSDNGPGIPEEQHERIFEPFVTDKEQGAGLGLAIVQKAAEANGGRVELLDPGSEEHSGEGAEFRVYLRSSDEFPTLSELSDGDE